MNLLSSEVREHSLNYFRNSLLKGYFRNALQSWQA